MVTFCQTSKRLEQTKTLQLPGFPTKITSSIFARYNKSGWYIELKEIYLSELDLTLL